MEDEEVDLKPIEIKLESTLDLDGHNENSTGSHDEGARPIPNAVFLTDPFANRDPNSVELTLRMKPENADGESSADLVCVNVIQPNIKEESISNSSGDGWPVSTETAPSADWEPNVQIREVQNFSGEIGVQIMEEEMTNFETSPNRIGHESFEILPDLPCTSSDEHEDDWQSNESTPSSLEQDSFSSEPDSEYILELWHFCDQCSAHFTCEQALSEHQTKHNKKRQTPQRQCSSYSQSDDHESQAPPHPADELFLCKQCPVKFEFKSDLKYHSLMHSKKRSLTCEQCPARQKYKGGFKQHLLTLYENRYFFCELCPARFESKYSVAKRSRARSKKKNLSCSCSVQHNLNQSTSCIC